MTGTAPRSRRALRLLRGDGAVLGRGGVGADPQPAGRAPARRRGLRPVRATDDPGRLARERRPAREADAGALGGERPRHGRASGHPLGRCYASDLASISCQPGLSRRFRDASGSSGGPRERLPCAPPLTPDVPAPEPHPGQHGPCGIPQAFGRARAVPGVPAVIEVIPHPSRMYLSIDFTDCFLPAWDRHADSHR
jgi:hypothetical protein